MRSAVITIGNELINGARSDTNSTFISAKLSERSIKTDIIISVGDDSSMIGRSIDIVLDSQTDFLFITGGLGPTHDDITKEALADYFNKDLVYDPKVKDSAGKKINGSQAMILDGSKPISNMLGTATGIYYNFKGCKIFVLPGVPSEMEDMINRTIIPEHFSTSSNSRFRVVRTIGISERSLSDSLSDIMTKYGSSYQFAFLPSKGSVDFRIVEHGKTDISINKLASKIYDRIRPYSFTIGDISIEDVVGNYLKEKQMTLAIAESCTGGLVSKMLTNSPGCSEYFLGSIVSYSNESKVSKLGVDREVIDKHGAVSRQVASSMACSVKNEFSADIGLAITGISGPGGGSKEKPVGLVYIAVATTSSTDVYKYIITTDRDSHREAVSKRALNSIRVLLESF